MLPTILPSGCKVWRYRLVNWKRQSHWSSRSPRRQAGPAPTATTTSASRRSPCRTNVDESASWRRQYSYKREHPNFFLRNQILPSSPAMMVKVATNKIQLKNRYSLITILLSRVWGTYHKNDVIAIFRLTFKDVLVMTYGKNFFCHSPFYDVSPK